MRLLFIGLVFSFAAVTPALAEERALPSGITEQVESLGDLLPSQGSGSNPAAQVIGQVQKVAFGSQGATVTLEGGKQVRLDFSGLTGVSGGPNYFGWGMLLFGMSVVTRLLSSLGRVLRPIARATRTVRRRGRDRYYDDEY